MAANKYGMEIETTTKTVKEVWEALDKNGLEHVRGVWFDYMDGKISGGCVLAQTGLNLNAVPTNESGHGNISGVRGFSPYTIAEQLDKFEAPKEGPWGQDSHEGAGGAIIYWNDKAEYDSEAKRIEYVLKTYREVSKMAYEILSPYFDKTVELAVYDYSEFGLVANGNSN